LECIKLIIFVSNKIGVIFMFLSIEKLYLVFLKVR
jgi:hypothetical protein